MRRSGEERSGGERRREGWMGEEEERKSGWEVRGEEEWIERRGGVEVRGGVELRRGEKSGWKRRRGLEEERRRRRRTGPLTGAVAVLLHLPLAGRGAGRGVRRGAAAVLGTAHPAGARPAHLLEHRAHKPNAPPGTAVHLSTGTHTHTCARL